MCLLRTPSEVNALHEHVCFENISRSEFVATFITIKTPYQEYDTSVWSVHVHFENTTLGECVATLVTI